jgi:uncharacterized cupredoxin-like copper-binding protein
MRGRLFVAAAFLLAPLLPVASQAATVIDVTLWDKGADAPMMTDMGDGPTKVDRTKSNMGIKLSRDRAPTGEVTFKVTNNSKDTVHEMIVVPAPAKGKVLPYVDGEKRIDEDAAGHLGEVSELEPGKSGSLTLNLKPGSYLVLCNVPMHYMAGMWQEITVTP